MKKFKGQMPFRDVVGFLCQTKLNQLMKLEECRELSIYIAEKTQDIDEYLQLMEEKDVE